jgi:hypothetical protein
MKISRRELAGVALAGAAAAQTPPNEPDVQAQAQQQVARNSETLLKFEVPMAAEPAFQFKA